MAKTKKRNRFRSKVSANTQKQRTMGNQYGHLQLPKGISIFKEEPGGRAYLDIVPYIVTDPNHLDRDDKAGIAVPGNDDTNLWYKKPYRLHRNIGPENKSIVCPSTWGRKCPICEYKATQLKKGVDYDEVRDLRPSLRNLYVVMPLGMKDYKEEAHLWDISQFLFQEMLNEELDENEDYCAFPDIEDGLSLRIRFSEEKFGKNTFAKASRIDFEERENQYDASILDDIPDLDTVISCPSYDEVEALFFGMDEVPTDEDPFEEEPEGKAVQQTTKRSRKSSKRTPEPEPDIAYESEYESEPDEDKDEDVCVACNGTGQNSRGGKCKPCAGTGQKNKSKEESSNAEERPARNKKTKQGKKPVQKKKEKCPHGLKFGVDTDTDDVCDECEIWDDCIEEQENA